jgi:hypothetical protein
MAAKPAQCRCVSYASLMDALAVGRSNALTGSGLIHVNALVAREA